jgi:hypothetical protein
MFQTRYLVITPFATSCLDKWTIVVVTKLLLIVYTIIMQLMHTSKEGNLSLSGNY